MILWALQRFWAHSNQKDMCQQIPPSIFTYDHSFLWSFLVLSEYYEHYIWIYELSKWFWKPNKDSGPIPIRGIYVNRCLLLYSHMTSHFCETFCLFGHHCQHQKWFWKLYKDSEPILTGGIHVNGCLLPYSHMTSHFWEAFLY